ncbi:Hypothetical protein, putative [Bodo saltans]|uniref:Uncharacterized protein n=1 Tax=Bodo saltans TaxID=75058 RepID=A0A0S4JDL4_BODSA|nr:Hypothetical protein, putative [Bodo saltans]|eukprot:CUG88121.1 Hypothetical protein, putative [Bodo saltans]
MRCWSRKFPGSAAATVVLCRSHNTFNMTPSSGNLQFTAYATTELPMGSIHGLYTQRRFQSTTTTNTRPEKRRFSRGGGSNNRRERGAADFSSSSRKHESTMKHRQSPPPRAAEPLRRGDSVKSHHTTHANATTTSQHIDGGAADDQLPWEYDHVNAATGKTPLEERFDAATQKVRDIFDKPLPDLPLDDGSIEPDVLVGFAFYNFRLRDQYRSIIAKMLGLHASEVVLSVGWSGRFDVSRFANCQKVCGVRIKRSNQQQQKDSSSSPTTATSSMNRDDEKMYPAGEEVRSEREQTRPLEPLSPELQSRIESFVHTARKRKDESLLNLHIINAATALKEVQFSKRNAEVEAVLSFLKHNMQLFSQHQVVILHNETESERQWLYSSNSIPINTTTVVANAVHAALARFTREGVVRFPAVFCNGTHVGSIPQMTYLQSNTRAFDAILMRPNDLSYAKKFLSKLSGDQRRREILASDATHAGTGKIHR